MRDDKEQRKIEIEEKKIRKGWRKKEKKELQLIFLRT